MKATTSMVELLTIMIFMVVSVPLLALFMYKCDRSIYSYLEDKTVVHAMGTAIMDDSGQPKSLAPIGVDTSAVVLMSMVQDNYAPNTCSTIVMPYFEFVDRDGYPNTRDNTSGNHSGLFMEFGSGSYKLNRNINFKKYWNSYFSIRCNNDVAFRPEETWYLVWDSDTDRWVATHINPISVWDK